MTSATGPRGEGITAAERARGRELRGLSIPVLIGAAMAVVGSVLPWWRYAGVSLSAWKIPFTYLLNGGTGGGVRIGPVLLVVVLAVIPLFTGRKLPVPFLLVLSWVPLAVGLCAFIRGLRASPSLHPDIGLILTLGGGALMAADALDVGIAQTKGLLLTLATVGVVILATSGGTTGGSGVTSALPPGFDMSALPVPHVASSTAASNSASAKPPAATTTSPSTRPSAAGTGSHTSTTQTTGAASSSPTPTTSAGPLTCWYPDSIQVSGGSPSTLSGQGGEFTVEGSPVVVSTGALPSCTSQYEIAVIGAHGMGHDCESKSFHYDVSDIVQAGDLVSVSFELPPNDCPG